MCCLIRLDRFRQAIAEALSLSGATVRTHLTSVYAKLEVASRAELLALVLGSGSAPAALTEQDQRRPSDQRSGAAIAGAVALASAVACVVVPLSAIALGPLILAVAYGLRSRPVGRFRWVRIASIGVGIFLTVVGVGILVSVLLLGTVGATAP